MSSINMSDGFDHRLVSSTPGSIWDAFVTGHAKATIFHRSGWLRAVESAFGYEPRHSLLCDTAGEPIAAVPGFVVSDGVGRSVVNPFCEYGFPLIDEQFADERVLSALSSMVGSLGAVVVKDVEWSGIDGYFQAGYGGTLTGTSQQLRLDRSFEQLWQSVFERQMRQRVRSAREYGVKIAEGTIKEFYPLYLETMRRLGSPQFPFQFFEALDTHLDDTVRVLLARIGGRAIGTLLALEWDGTVHIWGNGSKREGLKYRPNHLLYTSLIEQACEHGMSVIDFGRSQYSSGVHEFKSQFGGVAYPLASFVIPAHRWPRASIEGYSRLAPVTRRLAPIVNHPIVGPQLKELLHE
jgi:CelD/BcsL family acetyltransferase involved in cellulose biosynthesis